MKADVLTLAAVVFVLGMIISGVSGTTDLFDSQQEPPAALQQGIATS